MREAAGNIFASQAVDRIAIINTLRGGSSRNVRRPDLLPGVDPFIQADGLLFLNPAAFATPQPGTFGNLERNSIHGPNFKQVDLVLSKRFMFSGTRNFEFRAEIFNLFNTVNFLESGGNATAGDSKHLTDGSESSPTRSAIHQRGRRHLRNADRHCGPKRRSRHTAPGAVGVQSEFLISFQLPASGFQLESRVKEKSRELGADTFRSHT
jgi:hypothetical protein